MDEFPVLPFRSTVYSPDELFAGFDPQDPHSYERTTDFRTYRSTRLAPSREVGMLRALHDQSITEARDVLLTGRRVVAIMGGHEMARTDPAYRQVAELAHRLTAREVLVVSGGGPGAMEATHLGAILGRGPVAALDAAIAHLAAVPEFPVAMTSVVAPGGVVQRERLAELHAWQRPAFEVLAGVPGGERGESLSVPTWFYGHEPPTPFASHIAKYFSNSLREDGLLTIAAEGIVFAPGRAGTLQEIFQDAAQNYYRVVRSRFSPMVFLDVDQCWTQRFPVEPILRALFGAEAYDRHVLVTDDPLTVDPFLQRDRTP